VSTTQGEFYVESEILFTIYKNESLVGYNHATEKYTYQTVWEIDTVEAKNTLVYLNGVIQADKELLSEINYFLNNLDEHEFYRNALFEAAK
jgi:hypothetical protein